MNDLKAWQIRKARPVCRLVFGRQSHLGQWFLSLRLLHTRKSELQLFVIISNILMHSYLLFPSFVIPVALRDLKSSLSLTKVNGFLDLQSNHENQTKILHEFLNSSNQRFVLTGNDMNCKQKDLNTFTTPAKSNRFAYVWYAASLPLLGPHRLQAAQGHEGQERPDR